MKPLKAIIFDMDGVITLTMPAHYRAWVKVFAKIGIKVPRFEVYRREGQKGLDSVMEISAKYGKPVSVAVARGLLLKKEQLFKGSVRTRFVPGATNFMKSCHRAGLKTGLVTGTARHEVEKILPEALIKAFDVIVCGSDVRNGKPHPEPYLKALKALKVAGGEAVVIENAPFGITSAVKAGLRCVAIETSLPRSYLKEANHVVRNYGELQKLLKRLCPGSAVR